MSQCPSRFSDLQGDLQLKPLILQLTPTTGALRPQIEALLASHGRPLRWAITQAAASADGRRSLQIEAVVLSSSAAP